MPCEDHADFTDVRILLAEDNPINSEIASSILSQNGFSVDVAENGKDAVDMLMSAEEDRYAAVLTDIQMPVMNGYDAARTIRAMDGKRAQIPIIALTANTFEDDLVQAREAGINALVAKPYDPDQMIAVLAEQMDHSGAQK